MEDDALLRCLREHRALFTGGCRAKVMSIERMAHNEMDFNAEVSEACAVELRTQCRGVDSRQQLSCLERMGEVRAAKLAPTCSRVLQGFKERAAQSVELMGKVSSVCREDYELLCASASALQHPGASIQCLKDSRGQLRSKDCKAAVLGLMAGASRDSRLDAPCCRAPARTLVGASARNPSLGSTRCCRASAAATSSSARAQACGRAVSRKCLGRV